MKRYVIALDLSERYHFALQELLHRPGIRFVDALEHLTGPGEGLSPKTVLAFPRLSILNAELSDEEVRVLRADPRVTSVRESSPTVGSLLTAAPKNQRNMLSAGETVPWHVNAVNADRCWERTTGRGVKVGIIDEAIARNLPHLPIVAGESFHPDAKDWFGADNDHGTACAAIAGYRRNSGAMVGIAPECDLYALRVSAGGKGNSTYIAAAMEWAEKMRLDVVSVSQWAKGGAQDPYEPAWEEVGRAAEKLMDAGCVVIGIAGNSGISARPWVTNPGRCTHVVATGATSSDNTWWYRSSYGPADLVESAAVEIVAPGNGVPTQNAYGLFMHGYGTSFAAPQIAGACALIKQLRPNLGPAEILAVLKSSAQDLGPSDRDPKFGTGLLDCYRAISLL